MINSIIKVSLNSGAYIICLVVGMGLIGKIFTIQQLIGGIVCVFITILTMVVVNPIVTEILSLYVNRGITYYFSSFIIYFMYFIVLYMFVWLKFLDKRSEGEE